MSAPDPPPGLEAQLTQLRQALLRGVGYLDRDVEQVMHVQASEDSARYAAEHMLFAAAVRPRRYAGNGHFELIERVLGHVPVDGFYAEFGVHQGESLLFLCQQTPAVIYGFDSFEGLPQAWSSTIGAGSFSLDGVAPPIKAPLDNFRLVKGRFRDSLPGFLSQMKARAGFLHLDCYTYESTREALDGLEDRIGPETVIVLRQYFNFPGWRAQQHRAWREFATRTGKTYRYLAFTPTGTSAAVQVG